VKSLEFTSRGEFFHAIGSTVENLNFLESGGKWDTSFTCEVVVLYSLLHETVDFTSYLIEISQTWGRHSVSFWESNLSLDLGWNKWESFSSIVLHSTWMWDVKMMVDIVGGQEAITENDKMKYVKTYDGA
jgi:hypothetical protein